VYINYIFSLLGFCVDVTAQNIKVGFCSKGVMTWFNEEVVKNMLTNMWSSKRAMKNVSEIRGNRVARTFFI
jgi:hypothetical protein